MQDTKSPVTVGRESPAYWRVTFDNPPLNLYDPEFVRGLSETVTAIEADPQVTVVVFRARSPVLHEPPGSPPKTGRIVSRSSSVSLTSKTIICRCGMCSLVVVERCGEGGVHGYLVPSS
jgi:hypothetical protein